MPSILKTFYYLYCFKNNTEKEFFSIGMNEKKVYALPYKDIGAVITEVDAKEFNPLTIESKLKDLKWAEEKVRNHESVIREAMEGSSVIPLKFLTLYKSRATIEDILKKQYKKVRNLLDKVKDTSEWGLKIYVVNKENLSNAIKKEDEDIIKMRADLSEKSEGARYFLEKKMKEKISEKLNTQLDKYLKDIFKIFLPFSIEAPVINKLLPKGFGNEAKEMILNISYLVQTKKTREFQNTVKKFHKFYLPKGLSMEISGPWPPYSFVTASQNKSENPKFK